MNKELLNLFSVNRDAFAVNRGFYYQYLCVLKKWIENFIQEKDIEIFTEVDEDIKEVGEKLVFTQIKCYSSTFSLNSKELTKAIFNFFILYLKEYDTVPEIKFVFETNTRVSSNEKLLNKWIDTYDAIPEDILKLIVIKVSEILHKELKNHLRKVAHEKQVNINQFDLFKSEINEILVERFIRCIKWKFAKKTPETAISNIYDEIVKLLLHEKFQEKPPKILLDILLSEIYRCSQKKDKSERFVTNAILVSILKCKEDELEPYISHKFINLLDTSLSDIRQQIESLQKSQLEQHDVIKQLSERINSDSTIDVFPKNLTLIPHVNPIDILGRKDDTLDLYTLLKERKHVGITGMSGMGKSTLAKLFVNQFEDSYDHIIWINAQESLDISLLENEYLKKSLSIGNNFDDKSASQLDNILRTLNEMQGVNLLVITDFKLDYTTLNKLKFLKCWQILLTTRETKSSAFHPFKLSKLSFNDAQTLYCRNAFDESQDDKLLKLFFESVNYNPLMIEIVAKTVQNSFDLDIASFLGYIEEQRLDDVQLEIDIDNNSEEESTHFFLVLKKIFDISDLNRNEQYYLGLFALLPSEEIKISELVEWHGKEYESVNKVQFANLINSLQKHGWVERNGDSISMHKMLQEALIYEGRKHLNAFAVYSEPIVWLFKRFVEATNNDIAKALRFLKYGESILNSIKEPYRQSIYQPLLLLENEVLITYNWLLGDYNLVERWKSLLKRAEAYLPNNDDSLGAMYNNYALVLLRMQQYEDAILFFEKSIKILKPLGRKNTKLLLVSLQNLCSLYAEKNDVDSFKISFDAAVSTLKKYKLFNTSNVPPIFNIQGIAFQKAENYVVSIKLFKMAIEHHLKLGNDERNDVNLVLYLINLSFNYLLNQETDKAISTIDEAYNQLERLEIKDSNILRSKVISMHIIILERIGDYERVNSLKSTLAKLYENKKPAQY